MSAEDLGYHLSTKKTFIFTHFLKQPINDFSPIDKRLDMSMDNRTFQSTNHWIAKNSTSPHTLNRVEHVDVFLADPNNVDPEFLLMHGDFSAAAFPGLLKNASDPGEKPPSWVFAHRTASNSCKTDKTSPRTYKKRCCIKSVLDPVTNSWKARTNCFYKDDFMKKWIRKKTRNEPSRLY